jgi:hypothetical protein
MNSFLNGLSKSIKHYYLLNSFYLDFRFIFKRFVWEYAQKFDNIFSNLNNTKEDEFKQKSKTSKTFFLNQFLILKYLINNDLVTEVIPKSILDRKYTLSVQNWINNSLKKNKMSDLTTFPTIEELKAYRFLMNTDGYYGMGKTLI